MIGKVSGGKGARGALNYVTMKDGAERVGGNMAGTNARELSKEFAVTRDMKPNAANPVKHFSLSLAPGERFSSEQWEKASSQFMEKMGYANCQFVAYRHVDTDNDHIHIVASRIDLDGKLVRDSYDKQATHEACRYLEQEHGIQVVASPRDKVHDREFTQGETRTFARTSRESDKILLQRELKSSLDGSKTLDEFRSKMSEKGIQTEIIYRREKPVDIFYSVNEFGSKGSRLGTSYNVQGLENAGLSIDYAALKGAKDRGPWDRVADAKAQIASVKEKMNAQRAQIETIKANIDQRRSEFNLAVGQDERFPVQRKIDNFRAELAEVRQKQADLRKELGMAGHEMGKAIEEATGKTVEPGLVQAREQAAKKVEALAQQLDRLRAGHDQTGRLNQSEIRALDRRIDKANERMEGLRFSRYGFKKREEIKESCKNLIHGLQQHKLELIRQDGQGQAWYYSERLSIQEGKYRAELASVNARFAATDQVGTERHLGELRKVDERFAYSVQADASRVEDAYQRHLEAAREARNGLIETPLDDMKRAVAELKEGSREALGRIAEQVKQVSGEAMKGIAQGLQEQARHAVDLARISKDALTQRSPENWQRLVEKVREMAQSFRERVQTTVEGVHQIREAQREAGKFGDERTLAEGMRERWEKVAESVQAEREPVAIRAKATEPPAELKAKAAEQPVALKATADKAQEALRDIRKLPEMSQAEAEQLKPILDQAARSSKTFEEYRAKLDAKDIHIKVNQGGNGLTYVRDGERVKASTIGMGIKDLKAREVNCESTIQPRRDARIDAPGGEPRSAPDGGRNLAPREGGRGAVAASERQQSGSVQDRGLSPEAVGPDREVTGRVREGAGGQGQGDQRRNLEHAGTERGSGEAAKRTAEQGRPEPQNHGHQRQLDHSEAQPGHGQHREAGAGAPGIRQDDARNHAGAGERERATGRDRDLGGSSAKVRESHQVDVDRPGGVRGNRLGNPHLDGPGSTPERSGVREPRAADSTRASQARASLKPENEAQRRLAELKQRPVDRPQSEATMRLEARQQDRRISDLDQQLKGLEQQKAAVVQQGLPQDQARASVQGIDRQIDQVKQQLGAELKAMEPRLQAANQAMEKASQELKLPQPPKLSVEGIKPEQARAASEYVNASSMAQQALSSALSGGGSKEVQKAVAAAKIAIEAATAISNPVSLAKAAVQAAKHVISMER